jgi:HAE1 family hydrophobic/amphiphilic exporter-1
MTLNIFSMIGLIMLMGLVTKNAILLVDYTNFLRRGGMDRTDALLKAGPVRLRPILMTALSTIAGMLPVAIGLGEGAESRAPMGACVVGGMMTSTVLTLVVIPVVYSVVDDTRGWIPALLGWFVSLGRSRRTTQRESSRTGRPATTLPHRNGHAISVAQRSEENTADVA